MIDTLVRLRPRAEARWEGLRARLGLERFMLVTLHRPSNVDDPAVLAELMSALAEVARDLTVVFPVHPRTRARLAGTGIEAGPGVRLLDPIGYLDFLCLEARAEVVLTDSGGIQEETTYLGIPCFTLRDNTERPVTIRAGTNTLLGLDPARITEIPELLRARPADNRAGSAGEAEEPARPYLWDGKAAERVADVLGDW
jgi:UDP-N-acetylglucosamine 2-epimerase (non-hydrolysing)